VPTEHPDWIHKSNALKSALVKDVLKLMSGVIKTQIRDAVRGAVAAGVAEVDLCALLTSVLQTIVINLGVGTDHTRKV
jgi:hypothetical protein